MTATDLRDRVADRAAAAETGTAVEKRGRTVFDLVRDQQAQFGRALPSMITPERFTRIALTTLRNNPGLANADATSLLGAFTICAQLGLEPGGPLGHAYLLPFRNNKTGKTDVQFIVGYKGLIALARRSGDIGSIYAECVYDGDEFEHTLGIERNIVHRPGPGDRTDPARITHAYAVAKFRDGSDPMFLVLTRAQIESFRGRSKAKNSGPWVTDYAAMAMKTAIRRLSTWLPMSTELAQAVERDEQPVTRIPVDADDFIDVEEAADEPADENVDQADETVAQNAFADEARTLHVDFIKANDPAYETFRREHDIPGDVRRLDDDHLALILDWAHQPAETN